MKKMRTTFNASRLRSLDDVRKQQEWLRANLMVQEQRVRIDMNNVRAAWNGVSVLNHRLQSAVSSIRPSLGYIGIGLGLAQLILKRRKNKKS